MADGVHVPAVKSEAAGRPMVGKLIAGRYRIEAVVDEGGEAVLYAARHEALGKRVALPSLIALSETAPATSSVMLMYSRRFSVWKVKYFV